MSSKIKVTFYNDVTIAKKSDNTAGTGSSSNAGFHQGGIYFTPPTDVNNNEPAHIIHGSDGFIYTLGSYVVSETNPQQDLISVVGNNYNLPTDPTYVISDIVADPFNKLLTVTKTPISLGTGFVDEFNRVRSFLKNLETHSGDYITVGDKYKVGFTIDNTGVLQLITDKLTPGNCKLITYLNGATDGEENHLEFTVAPENTGYFIIESDTSIQENSIKIEYIDLTQNQLTNLWVDSSQINIKYNKDESGHIKTAKITLPNNGWNYLTYNGNLRFKITLNTIASGDLGGETFEFTVTLKRVSSPYELQTTKDILDLKSGYREIKYKDTSIFNENFDVNLNNIVIDNISYTGGSEYFVTLKTNDIDKGTYLALNAYFMSAANATVTFNYKDNSLANNQYYAYLNDAQKSATFKVTGAGLWTLTTYKDNTTPFQTITQYYNSTYTVAKLVKPTKDNYTFSYWKDDKGNKVESTKITFNTIQFGNDYKYALYPYFEPKANTIKVLLNGTELNPTASDPYTRTISPTISNNTFILTAQTTITPDNYTWSISDNIRDYISISGEKTQNCSITLKKWMPDDFNKTNAYIKVTTSKTGFESVDKFIYIKVNGNTQTLQANPTSLSWSGSEALSEKKITISGCKTSLSVTENSNITSSVDGSKVSITPNSRNINTTVTIKASETNIYKEGSVNVTVKADAEAVKYYWYAGWTKPTEANIGEIINEEYPVSKTDTTTSKAGGYKNTNQGFGIENNNFFASITTNRHNIADTSRENSGINTNYYIVVPNNMGIYSSNSPTTPVLTTFTKHTEFANHIVYISNSASRNINALVIY